MWRLLKAEYNYNKKWILMIVFFVPVFLLFEYIGSESIKYILFPLLTFLMVNNVNLVRHKEKRDRYHTQLPVSINIIALSRILVMILPLICFTGIDYIFMNLIEESKPYNYRISLLIWGSYFVIFPIFFIVYDFFSSSSRRKETFRSTRTLVKIILSIIFIGILILYIFVRQDQDRWYIEAILNFFIFLETPKGVQIFYCSVLSLYCLSFYSYLKRKTYRE